MERSTRKVHTGRVSSIRRLFDGTGPYSGFAVASWLIGLIWFLTIVMSNNGLDWWLNVSSVQGRDMGGLVYYSVDGVNHTVNDPQSFPGSPTRTRTVYYLPSNPGDATLSNTASQILDWGLTAGPGAIGLGLFATGFAKRRRRSTRAGAQDEPDSFGNGIPTETIKEIVARNRGVTSEP